MKLFPWQHKRLSERRRTIKRISSNEYPDVYPAASVIQCESRETVQWTSRLALWPTDPPESNQSSTISSSFQDPQRNGPVNIKTRSLTDRSSRIKPKLNYQLIISGSAEKRSSEHQDSLSDRQILPNQTKAHLSAHHFRIHRETLQWTSRLALWPTDPPESNQSSTISSSFQDPQRNGPVNIKTRSLTARSSRIKPKLNYQLIISGSAEKRSSEHQDSLSDRQILPNQTKAQLSAHHFRIRRETVQWTSRLALWPTDPPESNQSSTISSSFQDPQRNGPVNIKTRSLTDRSSRIKPKLNYQLIISGSAEKTVQWTSRLALWPTDPPESNQSSTISSSFQDPQRNGPVNIKTRSLTDRSSRIKPKLNYQLIISGSTEKRSSEHQDSLSDRQILPNQTKAHLSAHHFRIHRETVQWTSRLALWPTDPPESNQSSTISSSFQDPQRNGPVNIKTRSLTDRSSRIKPKLNYQLIISGSTEKRSSEHQDSLSDQQILPNQTKAQLSAHHFRIHRETVQWTSRPALWPTDPPESNQSSTISSSFQDPQRNGPVNIKTRSLTDRSSRIKPKLNYQLIISGSTEKRSSEHQDSLSDRQILPNQTKAQLSAHHFRIHRETVQWTSRLALWPTDPPESNQSSTISSSFQDPQRNGPVNIKTRSLTDRSSRIKPKLNYQLIISGSTEKRSSEHQDSLSDRQILPNQTKAQTISSSFQDPQRNGPVNIKTRSLTARSSRIKPKLNYQLIISGSTEKRSSEHQDFALWPTDPPESNQSSTISSSFQDPQRNGPVNIKTRSLTDRSSRIKTKAQLSAHHFRIRRETVQWTSRLALWPPDPPESNQSSTISSSFQDPQRNGPVNIKTRSLTDRSSRIKPKLNYQLIISGSTEKRSSEHQDSLSDRQILPNQTKAQLSAHHFRIHRETVQWTSRLALWPTDPPESNQSSTISSSFQDPQRTVQWTSRLALWPTDPPESNQSSTISSSFQDPQRNGPVNIKTRSLTARSSRIKPKLNYQLIISGSTEKRSSGTSRLALWPTDPPESNQSSTISSSFQDPQRNVQWTSRLALWPTDPPESNQSSTISSSFQDPQRNGPVNIKTRSLTARSSRIKPKLNYQLIISGSTEKRSSEHQDSLSDRQILPNQTKAQLSAHHFRIHRETVQWTSRLALWPTDPPESNQSSTISSSFQDPQRNGPVNIKTRSLTDRSSRIKNQSSTISSSFQDPQRNGPVNNQDFALWPTDPPESNQKLNYQLIISGSAEKRSQWNIKTRSLTDRSSRIKPKLNYQLIISGSTEKRSSEHQDSLSDRQILPNQTKAQLSAHHFRIHRENGPVNIKTRSLRPTDPPESNQRLNYQLIISGSAEKTVQWSSRLALWPTDPPESNQSSTISSSFQDPQRNGPVEHQDPLSDRQILPNQTKAQLSAHHSGSTEKRSSEHQDPLSDRQILPNQTKAQLSAHHFRIHRETVQWTSRLALWPTDPPESNQSSLSASLSFQDPQRNGPVNIKTRLSDRQILPRIKTKAQLSAHHFRIRRETVQWTSRLRSLSTDRSSRIKPKLNYQLIISGIHRETVQWTSRPALWPPDPPESNQSSTISSSFQDPQRNGPVNIKTRSLTDRSSRIKPKLNYQLIISGSTEKRSSEHQDSLSDRQILPNQTKAQLSAHHFRIHRETVQWTSRLALWPTDPPESNQSSTISSSFQDPQRNGPVNIKTRSLTDRSSRIKPKAQLSAHHFRIHRETVQWTSRLALWPTDPPESNQSSTISSSFQDPQRNGPENIKTPLSDRQILPNQTKAQLSAHHFRIHRETVQWTSRLALWPTDPPESNQSSTISSSFQDPQRNGPVNIKTRSLTDRSSRIKPKLNYQLIISGSTEKRSSEHQDSLSDRQILPNQTKLNYQLIISGSTEKRSSEHQDSLSDRQILPNQTKAQLSAHHFRIHRETVQWTSRLALWPTDPPESKPKLNYQLIISGSTEKTVQWTSRLALWPARSSRIKPKLNYQLIISRIHRETVQWTSRLALWPTDPPESNQSSTISSSFQDPQRNGPVNIKTRSLTDRSSRIKPKLNYQLIISGSTEKRSSEHQDSLSDRQISRINQSSTISSSFQDPQRNGPENIKTRSLTDRSSRIKPKLNYQLIISGSTEKRSSEHQDSLSDRQILPNQTKAQLSAHHFRIHRETVQWTSRPLSDRQILPNQTNSTYQLIISGSTEKRSSEHQDSLSDRQILPNQTKAQLSAHHFRIHRETVQWTSRLALWPTDPPESNQSSTISSSFQDPQRNGPVNIKTALWPTDPPESNQSSTISSSFQDPQRNGPVNIKTRSLTDRSSRIKPKLNYQLIISGSTEKRSSEHQDSLSDRQILPNQTKAQLSAHHFRIHRETVQWTSRLALWPTDPPESNQSSTISSSFQDPQRNGPVNIKTRSLTDRSSRIKPKLNYQLIISGSTEKRSSEHQDSLSDRQILPNQTKAQLSAHHFRIHKKLV